MVIPNKRTKELNIEWKKCIADSNRGFGKKKNCPQTCCRESGHSNSQNGAMKAKFLVIVSRWHLESVLYAKFPDIVDFMRT